MFSRALSRISLWLAIFAAALMTACGGGDGNPSSPYKPLELHLSESKMAYGPITLYVHGGQPPYYFETNSSATEVPRESDTDTVNGFVYPVSSDGTGVVYVWDKLSGHVGRVSASYEHVKTEIEPSGLTVTPAPGASCTTESGDSGYAQICSGSQGVADLQFNSIRNNNVRVRFSVVSGDFEIRDDTSAVWGLSAMTTTDSLGKAQVAIRAKANVPTQVAKIRAEIETGERIETSFIIIGLDFQMLPTTASWTSASATCPSRTASFSLYGGTPPYSLTASLGSLSTSSVSASGGSVVLTVATCGTGALSARDSVGNMVTASVSYTASGADDTTTPVVTTPAPGAPWGSSASRVSCSGAPSIFGFTVAGGTPPYTAYVLPMGTDPTVAVMTGGVGQVTFATAPAPASNFTVYVVDSKNKVSTNLPVIYCN